MIALVSMADIDGAVPEAGIGQLRPQSCTVELECPLRSRIAGNDLDGDTAIGGLDPNHQVPELGGSESEPELVAVSRCANSVKCTLDLVPHLLGELVGKWGGGGGERLRSVGHRNRSVRPGVRCHEDSFDGTADVGLLVIGSTDLGLPVAERRALDRLLSVRGRRGRDEGD